MPTISDILSAEEIEIVRACLRAAVEGDFFPEWEFRMIFRVDRDTVRTVHDAWPGRTVTRSEFECAIRNSLNNLTGYPHGKKDKLPAPLETIDTLLDRLSAFFDDNPFDRDEVMIPISAILSDKEIEIVRACLCVAVEGEFFHDWEFRSLFGIERDTVRIVLDDWPSNSVGLDDLKLAVFNSLGLLVDYPHVMEENLPAPPEIILSILDRLTPFFAPVLRVVR